MRAGGITVIFIGSQNLEKRDIAMRCGSFRVPEIGRGQCEVYMNQIKKVSFVIPCYRSEHTLPHVITEITEKMKTMEQYEYDIFLVNDCSPDDTFEIGRAHV